MIKDVRGKKKSVFEMDSSDSFFYDNFISIHNDQELRSSHLFEIFHLNKSDSPETINKYIRVDDVSGHKQNSSGLKQV